ncbi:MAG: hypothetical protein ACJATM_001370, partial [Alphaproteobacteria bacterium]
MFFKRKNKYRGEKKDKLYHGKGSMIFV